MSTAIQMRVLMLGSLVLASGVFGQKPSSMRRLLDEAREHSTYANTFGARGAVYLGASAALKELVGPRALETQQDPLPIVTAHISMMKEPPADVFESLLSVAKEAKMPRYEILTTLHRMLSNAACLQDVPGALKGIPNLRGKKSVFQKAEKEAALQLSRLPKVDMPSPKSERIYELEDLELKRNQLSNYIDGVVRLQTEMDKTLTAKLSSPDC